MTIDPAPGKGVSILRKKVAGVPVIYLGVGTAIALSVVAWRTQSDPGTASEGGSEASDPYVGSDAGLYPDTPQGTVVVAPDRLPVVEPDLELTRQDIPSNTVWLQRGINFLTSRGVGAGDAQAALVTYLEGQGLTFDQGKLRDQAVAELGPPPVVPGIGGTRPKPDAPAAVQGPLPRTHYVRGTNDDSYGDIAQLYYRSQNPLLLDGLQGANGNIPAPFRVGSGIKVPAPNQREYYTVKSAERQYYSQIARSFGLTSEGLQALNPGLRSPFKIGTKVRVK